MILYATLVVPEVGLIASGAVLAFSDRANLQTWATATVTSIITGYLGYSMGAQSKFPAK